MDKIPLERVPRIFCLGLSYKSAPLDVRESFALLGQGDRLQSILQAWKASEGAFQEVFILSTCNRFEVYVVADGIEWRKSTEAWFGDLGLNPEGSAEMLYFYEGFRAIQHAFLVASSLDSMLLGETQITGQFKQAIQIAKDSGTLGPIFHRLWQDVLRANKQVRSRTRIGVHTLSLSHAAIDLSKRIFRDLSDRNVLFVGAGEMIQMALRYVVSYQPKNIWVANRTLETAQNLVSHFEDATAYSLDALENLLTEADIVVICTASQEPLITQKLLLNSMRQRMRGPIYLMDLGLPRNIEPTCGELSEVYLFNLDDLKAVIDSNRMSRESEAEIAREMLLQRAKQFGKWLESHGVRVFLGEFHKYIDALVIQEREKTMSKEIFSQLTLDQKNALNQMLQSVCSKLVSDVAKIVQKSPEDAALRQWMHRIASYTKGQNESRSLDNRH